MKKFFALVLALVMALSLTTMAWGADPVVKTVGSAAGCDYGTLAEAVADAQDGWTIKLMENATIDALAERVIISGAKTVTLAAANGAVLTTSGADNPDSLTATNGGTLILDSSVKVVAHDRGVIWADNGTIIVNGAEITSDALACPAAVRNGGKLVVNAGSVISSSTFTAITCKGVGSVLEINGGTISAAGTDGNGGNYVTVHAADGGVINMNDGVVKGANALDAGVNGTINMYDGTADSVNANDGDTAKVNIYGGTVTGSVSDDDGAKIVVKGGTFTTANVKDYLADGTELISDGAGGYIAATAATGSTASTKFYVSNSGATDDWQLLGSYAGVKPADFLEEADYDETIPQGNLEHYVVDGGLYLAATKATGAYKLVCGNVEIYLNAAALDEVYYEAEADVFTGLTTDEDACGSLYVTKKNLSKTYYKVTLELAKDVEEDYYLVKVTSGGDTTLLVNGKIVKADFVDTFVEHEWVGNEVNATTKAYTSLICENCGKVAKLYGNADAAGKGAVYEQYGWITKADAGYDVVVSTTPSTDKVTSAETFDAGIAMYVGMSVMAATGAVVLKKRED